MSDAWARMSKNKKYRYLLGRRVNDSPHRLLFIMLNPSTADANKNDGTINKCKYFAEHWGYGVLEVVNLFAWRSRYPDKLLEVKDPVGKKNDDYISNALKSANTVVLGWGDNARSSDTHMERAGTVLSMAHKHGRVYHLGLTNKGEPRHPVPRYVPYSATLIRWTPEQITQYLRTHPEN